MRHVFYARFDRASQANEAVRGLAAAGLHRDRIQVRVHGDVPESELALDETRARPAWLRGVLLGGAIGVVAGLVVSGALDLVPGVIAAAFGAFAGAVSGGLGALLTGTADPDRHLERLGFGRGGPAGQVFVTVEVPSLRMRDRAAAVLRERGATAIEGRDRI